jgi:hypothetical protein
MGMNTLAPAGLQIEEKGDRKVTDSELTLAVKKAEAELNRLLQEAASSGINVEVETIRDDRIGRGRAYIVHVALSRVTRL